jgi:hypothetical protein
MMTTFWIKILLMPSAIAGVTMAGRKWGNVVGGILGSFPWVAGPIILFIALEQGTAFAVQTIPGIMVGIIGWLAFCVVYLLAGQYFNAFWTVLIGYLVYILVGILLQEIVSLVHVNVWYVITLFAAFLTVRYLPRVKERRVSKVINLKYEIPFRMAMITAFVIGITYFATILGPTWSGILTPFPIMSAVLAIFTHLTQGIHQVRMVILGLFTGTLGFTTFLFSQAYLMPALGIIPGFILGILLNLVLTMGSKKVMSRIY